MIINKNTNLSYLIATLILCSLSESSILLSKNVLADCVMTGDP